MFRKAGLEQLRLRKERLVARSESYRSALAADWQALRSLGRPLDEASWLLRRHPLWAATLAAAAGTLAFRVIRRPGALIRRIGRWGRLASVAFSAWNLFNGKKPES
jgi:hypothetical protein